MQSIAAPFLEVPGIGIKEFGVTWTSGSTHCTNAVLVVEPSRTPFF